MAKLLVLLALCVLLPALVASTRVLRNPLILHGRVYCDTCKCGFETPVTTYIAGARIRVECKLRDTLRVVYSTEAVTSSSGAYEVSVADDHDDQLCESVLISSPQKDCASAMPGRERARVILTNNNGINSNNRFANNLGFIKDEPLAACAQVLKLYEGDEV